MSSPSDESEEFDVEDLPADDPLAPDRRGLDLEPGPALVGVVVAVAGVLFIAQPFVDPVVVDGRRVPLFVLSGVTLGLGLSLGAVVFARRGQPLAAVVHGVTGAGFLALLGGVLVGGPVVVYLGLAAVLAAAVGTVATIARDR